MKLSLSSIAWETRRNEEMMKFMSSLGFYGYEVAPTMFYGKDPYDKQKIADVLQDHIYEEYDLSLVSLQSIWYGVNDNIFDSEKSRDKLLKLTTKIIDFSSYLCNHVVVFGSPKNRIMNNVDSDIDIAFKFFDEIGKYAEEQGVVFCIEANPTIYGTNFLNTTREALDFVDKLDNPGLGVNLDFGTIIANEETLDFSYEDLYWVEHVHISEPMLTPIKRRDEHKVLREILEDYEYDGCISVEMKLTDRDDDIKDAALYLKEVFG